MISDTEIRQGYFEVHNKIMEYDDLIAFKKFVRNFQVEHLSSFKEMHEAIVAHIEIIEQLVKAAPDEVTAFEILHIFYASFIGGNDAY